MTPADLHDSSSKERRYATLVALAVEGTATVTDEVIDLHRPDRGHSLQECRKAQASGAISNGAGKRSMTNSGSTGRVGQALLEAKQNGRDPFAAIEAIVSWEEFARQHYGGTKTRPAGRLRLLISDRRGLQHPPTLRT